MKKIIEEEREKKGRKLFAAFFSVLSVLCFDGPLAMSFVIICFREI
jgi:hypothetical protein